MEVYRTEEEQVEAIRNWWKENGLSIIAGIAIGIVVIFGYRYWNSHQLQQAQQASALYDQVLVAAGSNDSAALTKTVTQLTTEFSNTPYAALSVLALAKQLVEKQDYVAAAGQLQWVLDHSGDEAMQHVARQRLARVLLAQNQPDQALTLIAGTKAQGFNSGYDEIRGDIYHAKGNPVQALENYRLALAGLSQNDPRYNVIKMKLDDLSQAAPVKEETKQ